MTPDRMGPGGVRRVVIVMPSLFTLANLFFGIWAVVLASRGEFYRAGWYIVIAGVLDMLDGLLARMGNAGSRFGGELDSLVDLVSFGVAPALIIYFLAFRQMGSFAWVFSYGYVVCAALRLARFNVQSIGVPKTTFTGLPSPSAGITLATYYPFTQTGFYQERLAGLPWGQFLLFLTMALSLAMVSNIRYAKPPRIGLKSIKGLAGLGVWLTIISFAVWERDIFFFPLGIAYVSYGLIRSALVAIGEPGNGRLPSSDEGGPLVLHDVDPAARQRRREPPTGGAGRP